MNVLTVVVISAALAAGEPGAPAGGKSPADGAKAKSPSPPKKPGASGSLDDDLFGDLTGDLFQGLDRPKLDKSEPKAVTGKEASEPATTSKPQLGKEPEKKSSEKPKAGEVDDFPPGEDLGQESNPLLDIGQRMRRVGSLISKGSTGDPTQRMQKDIVSDLDKLIKLASQT